ncbi:hypothetical protein KBD08_03375 [Candidatus Babeliales bacterium]|nr:hypothetical protein [Candidatus Babeliales bacterium]
MKKIYLKLTDDQSRYWIFKNAQTQNYTLGNLIWFLEAWGDYDSKKIYTTRSMNWEWLHLDKSLDEKTVCLWDSSDIKKKAKIQNLSPAEKKAFDDAYNEYYDKRYDDIPKLCMNIENYVEITEKWQKIVSQAQYTYIILSQDDAGYVDLVGKNELSDQDLQDMQREHQKYLKRQAAYAKYVASRPDIFDDIWYGPESSEYEDDWKKFLDEPLD